MARTAWLAAWMVGCGGADYCESSKKWLEDCGGTVSDADLEECRSFIEPCDGSDQKALVDSTECLMDAGLFSYCPDEGDQEPAVTTTGTTGELTEKLLECNAILADVSPECLTAAMGGSTGISTDG